MSSRRELLVSGTFRTSRSHSLALSILSFSHIPVLVSVDVYLECGRRCHPVAGTHAKEAGYLHGSFLPSTGNSEFTHALTRLIWLRAVVGVVGFISSVRGGLAMCLYCRSCGWYCM